MPLRGTLGWAAERRPTGKMLRHRKRLGIAPRKAPQRRMHVLLGEFGKTIILDLCLLILYNLEIIPVRNYKGQNEKVHWTTKFDFV
jgi:hypothetical protein